MKEKLVKWVLGKINWGAMLPKLLRMAAEGKFGAPIQKTYWWLAGKKTFIGAAGVFIAAGAAGICGQYEQFSWACDVSSGAMWLFGVLAGVGLVDGATRAPWPDGTPKG